jgi:hypothetical protein
MALNEEGLALAFDAAELFTHDATGDTFYGYAHRTYNDASSGGMTITASDMSILCLKGPVTSSLIRGGTVTGAGGQKYLIFRDSHKPENAGIMKIFIRKL